MISVKSPDKNNILKFYAGVFVPGKAF